MPKKKINDLSRDHLLGLIILCVLTHAISWSKAEWQITRRASIVIWRESNYLENTR